MARCPVGAVIARADRARGPGPGDADLPPQPPWPGRAGAGCGRCDALSADEALLLARELPHLSALIDGNLPGMPSRTWRGSWRSGCWRPPRATRSCSSSPTARPPTQNGSAGSSTRRMWRGGMTGGLPAGFFAAGETRRPARNILHVLEAWTRVAGRPVGARQTGTVFYLCLPRRSRPDPTGGGGQLGGLWAAARPRGEAPGLDAALSARPRRA